jgi:hypothetical protein
MKARFSFTHEEWFALLCAVGCAKKAIHLGAWGTRLENEIESIVHDIVRRGGHLMGNPEAYYLDKKDERTLYKVASRVATVIEGSRFSTKMNRSMIWVLANLPKQHPVRRCHNCNVQIPLIGHSRCKRCFTKRVKSRR